MSNTIVDADVLSDYADAMSEYPAEREYLIPILQRIQEEAGYLPKEAIYQVSDYLNLSEAKIYGVATFYNQFKLIAPGRHQILVCRGTACHVKGSLNILETLVAELGIEPGETTKDGQISLEVVSCIGACSIAPVIMIDGEFLGRLDKKKLKDALGELRALEANHA